MKLRRLSTDSERGVLITWGACRRVFEQAKTGFLLVVQVAASLLVMRIITPIVHAAVVAIFKAFK